MPSKPPLPKREGYALMERSKQHMCSTSSCTKGNESRILYD